ncbi:hypothetical protein HQQ94_17180 [Shewanella sp. VB17]|uniref:hypothetical protein n=1 Tax=Shewanella sp. VB17 TaxID=2739432 RepID=UPI001564470B|nr:hypothetical protein [Shewanella sp. VB17]NRD74916.1 hypothetical protein [Shewanella sp. VB17]
MPEEIKKMIEKTKEKFINDVEVSEDEILDDENVSGGGGGAGCDCFCNESDTQ